MIFMTAKQVVINGIECLVTRSGYTGEDGFEISLAAKDSEELAKLLLSNIEVEWVGLRCKRLSSFRSWIVSLWT